MQPISIDLINMQITFIDTQIISIGLIIMHITFIDLINPQIILIDI